MNETSPAKENTIYVFVDASNLWEAQKAKGKLIDFEKTKKYVLNLFGGTSIKVFYYTAYPADGTRSYSLDGRHRFYVYLQVND